jgi:FkbH-like protein
MPIDVVENFISRGPDDRSARQQLLRWLKDEIKARNDDRLREIFPHLLIPGLDYTTATSLHRVLNQIRDIPSPQNPSTRIAVLGSVTTHQIAQFLDLHLQTGRINAQFYEANYGTINQELLDHASGLRQFRPDFVVICTSWRDLKSKPALTDGREEVAVKIAAEISSWSTLWQVAREELGCQVIQSNFAAPPWRTLGNLDGCHPGGFSRFISLVNHALADGAPPEVTILDVERLAADSGRNDWGDERFYFQAKLPCSPEYLVDYSYNLAAVILGQLGLARKCLVLDLDNTLWGGLIGDDGVGEIRLGQGDPESEAFLAFQSYVKSLGDRGVILAVCSKNADEMAREVFEKHPAMVLRLEDISCFIANWDDKPANLVRISKQLNIGLNSLVFFDDNPAERSIVRRLQPDVAVPEVPDDPAYRIQALDRHRYFEATTISSEDVRRKEFYRANSQRETLKSSTESLDDFLRSLNMQARTEPVGPLNIERTVQLINRSNQFNLTTRRYTNADLLEISSSPMWITRTIRLRDRFGDSGLISVLLARVEANSLVIDTWLMSCRVLRRGVEAFLLNHLVEDAVQRRLVRIVGEYVPTAKNGLVKEHYRDLGFTQTGADPDERTLWELRVDDRWLARPHFINEMARDDKTPV